MESYVWRLVKGLSDRGFRVSVICEQVLGEVAADIGVLEVDAGQEKPRWKSMATFRERVDVKVKNLFKGEKLIIHSHERAISHNVTTFHGSLIKAGGSLNWRRFSPRVRGWKNMECHELLSPNVQFILPVSNKLKTELLDEYPSLSRKHLHLAWPGIDKTQTREHITKAKSLTNRFIFVGKEWKRKGLLRAIEIVKCFRESDPLASLDVYGVTASEVHNALSRLSWVTFRGWSPDIPWSHYDVLIHPAKNEPFGMVVAEARAFGVGVLMSNQVGAIDLELDRVSYLALDAPMSQWIAELQRLSNMSDRVSEVKWTWDDLVDQHCNSIYPNIRPIYL